MSSNWPEYGGGVEMKTRRLAPTFIISVVALVRLQAAAYTAGWAEFQKDRVASKQTMLTWTGPPLPPMTILTACARFMGTQGREIYPVLSYATPVFDNELLILLRYPPPGRTMKFVCCSGKVTLELPVQFALYAWNSFCLTVDLQNVTYDFWFNGALQRGQLPVSGKQADLRVAGGGVLVVGQDQDAYGGGYSAEQSMAGLVADLRLYPAALAPPLCGGYTRCEDVVVPRQALLDLTSLNRSFSSSDVAMGLLEVNSSLCSTNLTRHILFPQLFTFREASDLCFAMGGAIVLPRSPIENEQLLKLAFESVNSCPSSTTDFIWLGFKYLYKTKSLANYLTHSNLTYDNVVTSKINLGGAKAEDSCGTFNGDPKDMSIWFGTWQSRDCLETRCTVCHFDQLTLITLRGLCDKSHFDKKFFASKDENGTFEYVGEYYSAIRLEAGRRVNPFGFWKLFRLDQPDLYATTERDSVDHYPTGLRNWTVHHDICDGDTLSLKLTVCRPGQFTCSNGACVPLSVRCNTERECLDGSDEIDCSPLIFPPFFYESVAPLVQHQNDKLLEVKFNIEILSIKSVDLRAFQFTAELVTSLEWRDGRLRFRNLDMADNLTKLSLDMGSPSVWVPGVSFMGAENTACEANHRASELFVLRKSDPTPNSLNSVLEDNIFRGDDNPFLLNSTYSVSSVCHFDFFTFPFDTQRCFLVVTLSAPEILLTPAGEGITFTGSRRLLEYYVRDVGINVSEARAGQTVPPAVVVTVTFQNLVTYYVISTFAPTLTLLVIGYLPFHFPLHDFNDRVMVTLTTLLVEAQFFTQVSETMPRTAYLRLVDLWFLFCIVVLFLTILALVVVNACYTHNMAGLATPPPPPPPPPPASSEEDMRSLLQQTVPALCRHLQVKSGVMCKAWRRRRRWGANGEARGPSSRRACPRAAWTHRSSTRPCGGSLALRRLKTNDKEASSFTSIDVTAWDDAKHQNSSPGGVLNSVNSEDLLVSVEDAFEKTETRTPAPQLKFGVESSRNYQQLAKRLNRWSQLAFPAVMVVFLTLYGGLAYRALVL